MQAVLHLRLPPELVAVIDSVTCTWSAAGSKRGRDAGHEAGLAAGNMPQVRMALASWTCPCLRLYALWVSLSMYASTYGAQPCLALQHLLTIMCCNVAQMTARCLQQPFKKLAVSAHASTVSTQLHILPCWLAGRFEYCLDSRLSCVGTLTWQPKPCPGS